MRAALSERDAANARTLADMDARISALNARLNRIMETVEGKIQNVSVAKYINSKEIKQSLALSPQYE